MTQKSRSDDPVTDEWFMLWRFKGDGSWCGVEGPFKSLLTAEREADSFDRAVYDTKVGYIVFTS